MHKELWHETDGHCVYCDRRSGGQDATKDHLVPKSRGGPNHVRNYVPACKSCNHKRSKGEHHKNPLDQVHPRHAAYVQVKITALLEWLEKRVKNEVSPRKTP